MKIIRRSSLSTMIVCSCALFCSCDTKQNYVFELLEFRTEIKEHCAEYSLDEWEDAIERYTSICQKLDEMQFTKEERLEIDKIKGEIAGYAATIASQEITDEVKTITDEIESFVEGFGNTFQLPKTEN